MATRRKSTTEDKIAKLIDPSLKKGEASKVLSEYENAKANYLTDDVKNMFEASEYKTKLDKANTMRSICRVWNKFGGSGSYLYDILEISFFVDEGLNAAVVDYILKRGLGHINSVLFGHFVTIKFVK